MPTADPAVARAAWSAALLELKGLRRVRTPAGARKYGQPIGTVIIPDFVPDLPELSSFTHLRQPNQPGTRNDDNRAPVSPGLDAARARAQAKLDALPPIDPELVAKRDLEAARIARGELRAGGEHSGNSFSRRRSRANLFREFGGAELGHAPCVHCGLPLHHEEGHGLPVLTRDKLRTFRDGGGYQLPNLVPACASCNASRGADSVDFEGPPNEPRRVVDVPEFGADGRHDADPDVDVEHTGTRHTGTLIERDVLTDDRVHRQRLVNGYPVDEPLPPGVAKNLNPEEGRASTTQLLEMFAGGGDPQAAGILEAGRFWELGEGLPDGVGRGEPKQCFANAGRLALMDPRYTYVEGFAAARISDNLTFPTHHAWVVDADGRVVDPTWHDGTGEAYFGAAVHADALRTRVAETGVWGYLDRQSGRHVFEPEDRAAQFDDDEPDAPGVAAQRLGSPYVSGAAATADVILASKPWLASAEDLAAGRIPGIRIEELRDGVAGHRRSRDEGVVTVSPSFLELDPFGRLSLLAHEIGHDVANELGSTDNERTTELLRPFRTNPDNPWKVDNPFGGSDAPFEMLADAYHTILMQGPDGGYEDLESDYVKPRLAVLRAVAETAAKLGLPTERLDVPKLAGELELPEPDFDVDAAHASLDAAASRKIRKRKSAVKFYAQRRDGRSLEEAQALANDYERAALREALDGPTLEEQPAPTVTPKPKANPTKPFAPAHPASGRMPLNAVPATERGGGGPIRGYEVGQRAWYWNYGDTPRAVRLVEQDVAESVTEHPWVGGADGQGSEQKNKFRTTHPVRVQFVDSETGEPTRRYVSSDPDETYVLDVENLWPADPVLERLEPPFRLTAPTLNELSANPLELRDLLYADDLQTMERLLKKRRAVALDSASDSYSGYLTPDLVELRRAKETGLRTLGRALGFDDADTDEAVENLADLLHAWAQIGGLFEKRERMHAAMLRLRRGEPADDVDTRSMLLQKAWSDATWRAKYGDDDVSVPISRFVTQDYAAQLEAMVSLTESTADRPALIGQTDVRIEAYPLSSWTATPGGVRSGWIGRHIEAVELKIEARRDETWLNVWSEEQFRTRSLKAPGEFIIDNRRPLDLENVEIEVHRADGPRRANSYGGPGPSQQRELAEAYARHVQRKTDSSVSAGAAGWGLATLPAVHRRALGLEVGSDDDPVLSQPPRKPAQSSGYVHLGSGEQRRYLGDVPADERELWEHRFGLTFVDTEAEELLDGLAAVSAERGWTPGGIQRWRDTYMAWANYAVDRNAALEGRFAEYQTEAEIEEKIAYYQRTYEETKAQAARALAELGNVDVDRALEVMETEFARRWELVKLESPGQYRTPVVKEPT